MAEEKEIEIKSEDKNVKASKMQKGRKSIAYLQKCKDEGTKLVQMCPANRDQYFTYNYLYCKANCRLRIAEKRRPARQLFLKNNPPPRGYQIDTASFLYPQGRTRAGRSLKIPPGASEGDLNRERFM